MLMGWWRGRYYDSVDSLTGSAEVGSSTLPSDALTWGHPINLYTCT
jgi:hypothetical protein